MIDLRYIKKLIEMLDGSSVDSVELSTEKGVKLRISKSPQQRGAVQVAAPMSMPTVIPQAPQGRQTPADGVATITESDPTPKADAARLKLMDVTSPMVGTYYAAPEPGARPYVAIGTRVTKGQVLCIIEAMKIMNEIEAEFDGVLKEILAQDKHPVEFGQVLFRIDGNG